VSDAQRFDAINVVIADQEPDVRRKLQNLLVQPGIDIVGEAADADTALTLTAQLMPHILLLDYPLCRKINARNGAAERRNGSKPVAMIVMLTAQEKSTIIDSFRLGAQGVVMKDSERSIWRSSIAAVAAGQYWLGNESLAVLIRAVCESPVNSNGPLPAKYYELTPRELEIIRKIADGRSNKQVGEDCSIRERTVKHHLTNIFGKVGVSSRLELALFARDHKILVQSTAVIDTDDGSLEAVDGQPNDRSARRMPKHSRSEVKGRVENA